MGDQVAMAEKYLFIVALVIAVLVYWAGGVKLITAGGPAANTLLMTAQGRTSQGQYPTYPSGGPTG
jgi:hypothetical protein